MPRALIFDLDDTLLDRRGSLLRYAPLLHGYLDLGVDAQDFVTRFMALDANGRRPRERFFELLANEFPGHCDAAAMRSHFARHAWRTPLLFPDSLSLIGALKARGYGTGIVTNGGIESQTAKLDNSGLGRSVDHYLISEAFGAKKPAPEIFLAMCDRLGADPADTIFIGDDPVSDVLGPAALGMGTIWIESAIPWPPDKACPAMERLPRPALRGVLERLLRA